MIDESPQDSAPNLSADASLVSSAASIESASTKANPSTVQLVNDLYDSQRDTPVEQIPPQLGNYLLGEQIGFGGMGIVFRAVQPGLSRPVAVKILRQDSLWNEERFEREAELASTLHHPNIVPVFDYGEGDNNIFFLAMPFIDGRSLDTVVFRPLREGKKRWQRIATIGRDCADALNYAHNAGVIHRDIKPANLILDKKNKIWITDFGLAKLEQEESQLSKAGEVIGTLSYMAPEQIRGECDERSDIYSLGLTLYELAIGERAWQTGEARISKLPPPKSRNNDVPKALSDIIARACECCPNERYQSAEELKTVLNRYLTGEKKPDRRTRTRLETWPYSERWAKKGVWIFLLVVMFLGIWKLGVAKFLPNESYKIVSVSGDEADKANELAIPEWKKLQSLSFDPNTGITTLISSVCGRMGDAEEYSDGRVKSTSSDLEMSWDKGPNLVGLRFQDLEIPKGAEIVHAYVQFTVDEKDIGETHLVIHVMDNSNAPCFIDEDFNISSRKLSPTTVNWSPPIWDDVYQCKEGQRTPNLRTLIQEVVDLENWETGNAIGLVIDGQGLRCAASFDKSGKHSPKLLIKYKAPAESESGVSGESESNSIVNDSIPVHN